MGQHPTKMIAKISSGSVVEGRHEEVLFGVALGQQYEIRALWQKRRTRELPAVLEVEVSDWRPCQHADVACMR